jgi:hypothetical protein
MRRRAITPFLLPVVLAFFLLYLGWRRPAESFGWYHDDALYFSTAKALAQGAGFRLPSVPGSPPEAKYPILYPWLLSWIWKWRPSFPANLNGAVWMTAFFACWFLLAAFQLLRGLKGIGGGTALLLAGLCAFHQHTLLLSGAVLSDIPFMALALTSAVLADAALRPGGSIWSLAAAAVLAGLSVLVRGFGLTVVAGLLAAAFYRKTFRRAAVFFVLAAPFAVGGLFWRGGAAAGAGLLPPHEGVPAGPGWLQTWLYYTSYAGFWKLCVPRIDVFTAMLSENLQAFLQAPAAACLFPPLGGGNSYAGVLFSITLSAGIGTGIVRQARGSEWKPIHFVFPLYSGLTLVWNYALMDRFLLLFLPLFYAGLWVEGRHWICMLRNNLRPARPAAATAFAGMLAAGSGALAALAASHYLSGLLPRAPGAAASRAARMQEKQQLYDWIRRNTAPGDRFIAYQDVNLYLYTGRQAMRPIAFSTEGFYKKDQKILERDLDHITDVARHIGARYWVMADDDFRLETGLPLIESRMNQLRSVLPSVFRTAGGRVEVYDLSCLFFQDRPECRRAARILLPADTAGASGT